MSRRNDEHYDGTSFAGDSKLAVALMHDERQWMLGVGSMRFGIKTKKTQHGLTVVTSAPPTLRGHINTPVVQLERFLRARARELGAEFRCWRIN